MFLFLSHSGISYLHAELIKWNIPFDEKIYTAITDFLVTFIFTLSAFLSITLITINMGILPVLSTIPPKKLDPTNNAKVDQWNTIIRTTSQQYQIPLWDYWYAMQSAPNQGISDDHVHPSAPADGATANFTPQYLGYGYNIRNLTALIALNAIWQQVLS